MHCGIMSMRKFSGICVALVAFLGQAHAADHERGVTRSRGVHVLREHEGEAAAGTASGGSVAMTAHGGVIMTQAAVRLVYAGPSWSQPGFVGDKIAGLDTFFAGFGGSSYASTVQEYAGVNGSIGATVTYQGHGAPLEKSIDGEDIQAVANAACDEYAAHLSSMPNAAGELIMIVGDKKRASSSYCAYHSAATCDNGQMIQFGYVWNLDDDPSCNPQDTSTGHSAGLAALANVIAHEVQEARTDPHLDGWFDASNAEIGDKCAWSFGPAPVTFTNGSRWKLQGEWSNAAYNAGTGFNNSSQQPGCIDHGAVSTPPAPPPTPAVTQKPAAGTLTLVNAVRCPSAAVGQPVACTGAITVTAVGAPVTLAATPAVIAGPAGEFTLAAGNCTARKKLSPGTSCAFGAVGFRPAAAGARSATVTVAVDSATATTTLAGTATATTMTSSATLTPSATIIRCGSAGVGRTVSCGTAGLRLTAVGGSVVLASSPLSIGDGVEFRVTAGSCTAGRVLTAGQSCTTGVVTFRPVTTGNKATSLAVSTTKGTGSVSVTGTGTASALARN